MTEKNEIYKDLSVDERIRRAERKIKGFFKNLSPERKRFIENPVRQLAVLVVTLERLADEINSGDVMDLFEQGKQQLLRENPALKSYNATIKSYTAVWKILADMLPQNGTPGTQAGEDLLNFAFGRKPDKK